MNGLDDIAYELAVKQAIVSDCAVIVVGMEDGIIRYATPPTHRIFGYEALKGQPRGLHVEHRARYAANPRPRMMGLGLVLRGRRSSGEEFPIQVSLTNSEIGGERIVLARVLDLSESVKTAVMLLAEVSHKK